MKTKILMLVLLCVVTTSCKKVTNVEVVAPVDTGSLKYQLTDGSGKGLANIKVHAYRARQFDNHYYIEEGDYSDTARTNSQGIASFASLKPDTYVIKSNNIPLDRIHYNTTEYVQIVAGLEKSAITKVTDFSGLVNMKLITDMTPDSKLPGCGVALVENPPAPWGEDLRKALDAAVVKGISDSNGRISLKIPSDVTYYTILFSPDKRVITVSNIVFILSKGEVRNESLHAGVYEDALNNR
jgi:hypothetical protein